MFTQDDITPATEIDEADYFLHVESDAVDILAAWVINDRENPRQRYTGQVHTDLETHSGPVNENTVTAGDFNWNVEWDESPNSPLCSELSPVRGALNEDGRCSAYHSARGDECGEGIEATFYIHKKK